MAAARPTTRADANDTAAAVAGEGDVASAATTAGRALELLAIALCVAAVSAAVLLYSATTTAAIFRDCGFLVGALHTAFGLSLVGCFACSYARLLTTSPGTTRDLLAAGGDEGKRLAFLAAANRGGLGWRVCAPCGLPKPPLAHHCSRCRACILRADHHCVWFGGCLGFGNYRHFVHFLLYLSLGSLYACATTYLVFGEAAARDPWTYRWTVVLALTSGGLSLALAALLAWHGACLRWGVGTLEMMDRVFGWHGLEEEDSDDDEEEEEEEEAAGKKNPGGGNEAAAAEKRQRQGRPQQQPAPPPEPPLPPHVSVEHLRDYPWNLGFERNVRLAFDLDDDDSSGGDGGGGGGRGRGGLPWWLRWLRVHGAPRRGNGWAFETQGHQREPEEQKKTL